MKYTLLVLTDHRSQSKENSIFALLQAMQGHPLCERIDIASRSRTANQGFFAARSGATLEVGRVTPDFNFTPEGKHYETDLREVRPEDYDAIFLRLPPPLDNDFLQYLTGRFPNHRIINRPSGLLRTASKAFLLRFPEVCPPMQLCETASEIEAFSSEFPIVLKPLRNYGGQGIVKIENGIAELDGEEKTIEAFLGSFRKAPTPYLAMKFLKNVSQGDKRIVVVNRQVLGGVLRIPPTGAWLCNAAQGGQAMAAELSQEEHHIASVIGPELAREGIVMYGFDTLVDDNGKRILSEINTLSIGGLPQMGELNNSPVVERAAALLWQYINEQMYGNPS